MCPPVWAIRMGPQCVFIFYHVSTAVECEFFCRCPSVWIFWCLYMIRLRLFIWARMPQKWCVPTVLTTTLSFTQRNNLQDDVTSCSWLGPLVPSSCSTLGSTAHSSWLWTWPFSAWFCVGTWGPLQAPRVSEHPSLATLSLSVFLVGFPSPYPSRSTWEEMTLLCLVPKPCPCEVDAQRNITKHEWASEWLPRWPGCLSVLPLESMEPSASSTVISSPCHVVGSTVAFSDGVLSLGSVHLKLLHVAHFFSVLNHIPPSGCASLFTHSLLKGILVVFGFEQLWMKLL